MQLVVLPQDIEDSVGSTPPTSASGTAFQAKPAQTSDTGEPAGTTTQSCGAPQDSSPFRSQFCAPLQMAGRSGEASCQPALSQIVACAVPEVTMQKLSLEQESAVPPGPPNAPFQPTPFQTNVI